MQREPSRDLVRRDGERRIREERSASQRRIVRQSRKLIQIQARLRLPIVQIVRGQQPVALRTDVPDLQQEISGKFALDIEVVLVRILGPKVRLKFAEQKYRTKLRPIHRLAAWWIENAIERVRIQSTVLSHKRRVKERVRKTGTAPEWRLGAELLQDELLNGIVEHAPTHSYAGLTGSAEERVHPARIRRRTPCQADPRRKGLVVGGRKLVRYALISRHH